MLFPDLDAAIVSAVAEANTDDDLVISYLYELAAGTSAADTSTAAAPSPPPFSTQNESSSLSPSSAEDNAADLTVFGAEFARLELASDAALAARLQKEEEDSASAASARAAPSPARASAFGSRWAQPSAAPQATLAGGEGVDILQRKYRWADRDILVAVYEAAQGNMQTAEELLIHASPDVLSIANVGGAGGGDRGSLQQQQQQQRLQQQQQQQQKQRLQQQQQGVAAATPVRRQGNRRRPGSVHVAEELRKRDVVELASGNARRGRETRDGRISRLREELYRQISERDSSQALFLRTRNQSHGQHAKRNKDAAERTWRELKACLCETEAFRSGTVDLHHLTADMAIELVDAKLGSTPPGARIVFITGRGNGSIGGRAVLLPRVQRHLTERGVSHTVGMSGGCLNARV